MYYPGYYGTGGLCPPPDSRQRQPAAFSPGNVCCSPPGRCGGLCSFGRREHRNTARTQPSGHSSPESSGIFQNRTSYLYLNLKYRVKTADD